VQFNLLYNAGLKHFSFSAQLSKLLPCISTGLPVKYLLFLLDLNETRIFSTDFRNIPKNKISRKSVQWELSCSRQTDMSKIKVAFRNFTNAPKKVSIMWRPRPSVRLCVRLDRCGEDNTLCPTGVQSPNRPASSEPAAFTSIQTAHLLSLFSCCSVPQQQRLPFYSRHF